MSVPELNRRLVLEAPERSPDGAGGFSETWVTIGTLWASVQARGGREAGTLAGPVSVGRFRVTIRAARVGSSMRPLAGQRMRMGTRIFSIEAVSEVPGSELYLRCDVVEEVAA